MSWGMGSKGRGLGTRVPGFAVSSGVLGPGPSISSELVVSWPERWVMRLEGDARAWSEEAAFWVERIGLHTEEASS